MNEPFQLNDGLLHIEKWEKLAPHLQVGFTTRKGGVSEAPFDTLNMGLHVNDKHESVIGNRNRLAKQLDIPLENWVSGEQVHGKDVKITSLIDRGKGSMYYDTSLTGVDGLITNQSGLLCTAFFADCVPIYFFDPVSCYIGIAHAGWRGSVQQIAKEMVHHFQSLGVHVKDLLVAIGPCITQNKYEVNEDVINNVPVEFRNKTVINYEKNRFFLDLKQLNVEILLQCGVLHTNIEVTNYCTFSHPEIFYSHRRDQGKTGRMLGYIGYKP